MRFFFGLFIFATLCGCSAGPRAAAGPADLPTARESRFQREGHEGFSAHDRELITKAQQAIRESGKLPGGASDDAYYRVRRTAEGYEVFAIYVTGYEGSKPVFTPCVHNAVRLREDRSVVKVLVGPECWP